MASSTLSSILLLLILSLLLSFTQVPVVTADSKLIDQACQKVEAYPICLQVFLSDPRSLKADLRGLALLATEYTAGNASKAKGMAFSLLKKAVGRDSRLAAPLRSCVQDYSTAVKKVGEVGKYLALKDYRSARTKMLEVSSEQGYCELAFSKTAAEIEFPKELGPVAGLFQQLSLLASQIIQQNY